MKILGVDPALQITGYGVIDTTEKKPGYIESGIIRTKAKDGLSQRLDAIYNGISTVIQRAGPQIMILEKVFVHHSHTTTAFLLGQARGTIVLAAAHHNIDVIEYAATQVKKSITGTGHATKQQVQRMVMSELSMSETPAHFDITDALALALTYAAHNHNNTLAQILSAHKR
jgi:crossover junction endodeoxyribonuclease RuvC